MVGSKVGSTSQRYCTQLLELIVRHHKEAKNHMRVSRFNTHRIRKASGSHASPATTSPPSFFCCSTQKEVNWENFGRLLQVCTSEGYLSNVAAALKRFDPPGNADGYQNRVSQCTACSGSTKSLCLGRRLRHVNPLKMT